MRAFDDVGKDQDRLLFVFVRVMVVASSHFLNHVHNYFGWTLDYQIDSLRCRCEVGKNPKGVRANLEIGCEGINVGF